MNLTENGILNEIDLAFKGMPGANFPTIEGRVYKYIFFLDLEHGYCETANSKIHLYADERKWAVVFEKCGYQNRGSSVEIELHYIGNCIEYLIDINPDSVTVTNTKYIYLIVPDELGRIENKSGNEMEQFELIDASISEVRIRGKMVKVELDANKYEAIGIKLREYDNPKKLIGFGDLIRYFSDTNPEIISATEKEIRTQIPDDLPKIMAINNFHHSSVYDKETIPSETETYQLIAKVLTERSADFWKPKLVPNNHWSNWESGHL